MAADEVLELAARMDVAASRLINPRSAGYKKLGIDRDAVDDHEAARLISENPRIMIRPLLGDGRRVVAGFDQEKMAELIPGP